jgi:hypothetical protein
MAITETNLQLKYKSMLGLNLINNTSDVDKPLSNTARNAIGGKLGLTGGILTGGITGTTGTFSNDVISNTTTPGYTGGISMLSLHTQLTSLETLISSISTSNNYITRGTTGTTGTTFPVKIPFSNTTIDQISNSSGSTGSIKSPYYICIGAYRPIAMTSINANYGFFGAWGIKRNAVDRSVWTNDWTFVTKLWFDPNLTTTDELPPYKCNKIVVKFGEDWDRWDKSGDINNRGDEGTTGAAYSDSNKNKYIIINNPTNTAIPFPSVTVSNMVAPNPNNPTTIAPFWTMFPDKMQSVSLISFRGGVYIVISYISRDNIIKIDFCLSDSNSLTTNVNSYISSTAFYDFTNNDTRPFHIYVNGGIPYWYFGMVLFNTSNESLTDYIKKYKTQFSIIY